MVPMQRLLVAIDGPAGSGKSTLAFGLAEALGLPYVNTGLMYRALTHRALASGVGTDDGPALASLLKEIDFGLDRGSPATLIIDGEQPGDDLTGRDVEGAVSAVARHPEVRRLMADRQRELGRHGAVMEGRDIGSVVFPDAEVKIFLDASAEERVGRRAAERAGVKGVEKELTARDALDSRTNPFVPAPEAVRIDNTGKAPEETLQEALQIVRARAGVEP
jgi:cytidylate kinase